MGAINRVPQKGEARSNLHVGGTAQAVELTETDREICDRIGPELSRRGLIFVGIDVIGSCLTEINVTSPTGIREMSRFTGQILQPFSGMCRTKEKWACFKYYFKPIK